MNYVVRLDQFEGPLDLLLHLIQKEEMDIYDIPIARITEQYLKQIEVLERLDLQPAGEYLVMAATLLRIKARMLLPRQPLDEDSDEDPRHELVQRLLEYKKFKEAATHLESRERSSWNRLARPLDQSVLDEARELGDEETFEVSMPQLMRALQSVLARFEEVTTHEIDLEPVSVEDRGALLRTLIRERGRLSFREIFERDHSRLEIIVTFVALLELIKGGELKVHQADSNSELWIFGPETSPQTRSVAPPPTPASGERAEEERA